MSNNNSSEELQPHCGFFQRAVRGGCRPAYLGIRAGACKIMLALVCSVCIPMYAMAQTAQEPQPSVIIERLVGQDLTYAIAQVGKLTFANDSVYLVAHEGNILGKEAQAKTHKIAFSNVENPTDASEVSICDFHVYPNPTSDHLTISGLEAGTVIRIYANDGKLIETTTADNNTATLPVSHLAQGTYLLQINTQIIKFIKQ